MQVYSISPSYSRGWTLKYPLIFGTVVAGFGLWWFYLRNSGSSLTGPSTSTQKRQLRLRKRGKLSTSSSGERSISSKSPPPRVVASPPAVHSPTPSPPPLADLPSTKPTPSTVPPKDEIRKIFLEIEKLKQTGQFVRAAELNRKLVPMVESHFGPFNKLAFSAHQMLFESLLHLDRYSEAEPVARKSLEIARNLPAPENELLVARVLSQLGDMLLRLDQPRDAIPFSQEALEIYQKMGDDSDKLGIVSWNLGLAQARMHLYAEAEMNVRRALLVLSSDDKLSLTCMLSLLGILFDAGKHDAVQETYTTLLQQLFGVHAKETDFFVPFVRLVCRNLLDRKLTKLASDLTEKAQAVIEGNENTRELAVMFVSDLAAVRRDEDKEEEASALEQEKILPTLKQQKTILPPLTLSKYLRSMAATIRNPSGGAGKGEYVISLAFREALPLPLEASLTSTRLEPGSKLLFEFENPSASTTGPLKKESLVLLDQTIGQHIVEYKSEQVEGFVAGGVYALTVRVESASGAPLGIHRQYFRYLTAKP